MPRLVRLALALASVTVTVTVTVSTATATPTTAAARTKEEQRQAVAHCQAAFKKLPDTEPAAKATMVAVGCSELYIEKRCQEAWRNINVPPSKRIGYVIGECRAAYCPLLASKPALCTADFSTLDLSARLQLWAALQRAIFERDLGPEETAVLGQALSKLNLPLNVVPTAPVDGPIRLEVDRDSAVKGVDLVLRVTKKSVSLYSRSGAEGTEQKPILILRPLTHRPGPEFDYGALRVALQTLVARRWPDHAARPEATRELALVVDKEVSFAVVKELLDAAREPFPNVVFMVSP